MYNINLDLKDKDCLVIGGGPVALRKVQKLLAAGAKVMVIAPHVMEEIEQWSAQGKLVWLRRYFSSQTFTSGKLPRFSLVFCATDSRETNHKAAVLAKAQGALVNSVTNPEDCDLHVPAVVSQGDINIAITTQGASPAFAGLIKQDLAKRYHSGFGEFLCWLKELREDIKAAEPDSKKRVQLWQGLLDEDIFDLILDNELERAKDDIRSKISSSRTKS